MKRGERLVWREGRGWYEDRNSISVHSAGAEQQIAQKFQVMQMHPGVPVTSALVQASGKMVLIDKLLFKLKQSGHKVRGQQGGGREERREGIGACQ